MSAIQNVILIGVSMTGCVSVIPLEANDVCQHSRPAATSDLPFSEPSLTLRFAVSILTRDNSQATFPSNLTVHRTDYSHASLLAIFKGQDAVVSTIGAVGLDQQNAIADAAAAAGVQRFIPSEFGCNTTNAKGAAIVFQTKVDQSLKTGFSGYNLADKTATIYDDGNRRVSSTTLKTIGLAVARTPQTLTATANKYLYIHSFAVSQNEVLAALQAVTNATFAVTTRTTATAQKEGAEKLARGDIMGGYLDLIMAAVCSAGTGNDFEREVDGGTANAVLGLPASESLEQAIKEALA
ncbi:hypothetical protein HDU87_007866 [Geranomyces variabilis]|uniref:NmrA-like domain-containing protein n=1 Tax=Geranomyces variabilis TaxID=109894 RepID=A0AAD5TFW6_9FUNG|nr:hypothetical protein HDU87_007866 [Geranomyces variabilis]